MGEQTGAAAIAAMLAEAGHPAAAAPAPERTPVQIYDYFDASGGLAFQTLRYEPKAFRHRQPDGSGGWIWSLKGAPRVPYRLPEVIEALALERTVFIVPGEKDADRLAGMGIAASCNSGGPGKWSKELNGYFSGGDVVVLPKATPAGKDHGAKVAAALAGSAARVRILDLPTKGDVCDWLDAGGTSEALHHAADRVAAVQPVTNFPVVWFGEEDKFPPRRWLVKGLLSAGELSVIFGPSGSGKSFLALDLAMSIAEGGDFFDLPCTESGVVYVAGEGSTGMRMRMTAVRRARGIDNPAGTPFAMIPRALDMRSSERDVAALAEDIQTIGARMPAGVGLIVVDTLSRMLAGGTDAEPRDMAAFINNIEKLREETRAHILVVHHTGKDRDRGMRGSTALRDSADTVIEIAEPGESDRRKSTVVKQKDGEADIVFNFRLNPQEIGTDEDGDPINSCTVSYLDSGQVEAGRKVRLSDQQELARRALQTAIAERGRHDEVAPAGRLAVTIDEWRRQCQAIGLASDADDESAFRKAFRRAREKLQRLALIGVERDIVWLAS